MATTAVKIFAKAPQPGLAKTRLAPALGERGAASVARRLLEEVAKVSAALPADMAVEFQLSPAPQASCWQPIGCLAGRACVDQGDGDLGQRMARAVVRGFNESSAVILAGSDCPALTSEHFQWARQALEQRDAAIIPATDGGYVLLALRAGGWDVPALFSGVTWSSERVLAQTRQRLSEAGLSWIEHSPLADLDEPGDIAAQPCAFIRSCPELAEYLVAGNA